MPTTSARALCALALALTTVTAVPAPPADAVSTRCRIIVSNSVGGYRWTTMPVARACSNTLPRGVAGTAQLTRKRIVVRYSERRTTTTEVAKATVHELAHHVEYRTTPGHRSRLYGYLGISNPRGDYFAFNDAYYYNGSLARWKQSPRERLAESVVNCTYGSPNHGGMRLVPRRACRSFLIEFRGSLAHAR